ncbi:MAG: glycoside hydrolase family 127 protein [Flavobacteriales bacterium]|nr:glycoside hydrolase family 127 protein [Flavobacteriales bacterium]
MEGLHAAADYLTRAQDAGTDAGLGSYHMVDGWGASYPETTGYALPTLLAMSGRLQRHELKERAVRAAQWLLEVQHPDGGWAGGRIGEGRPSIVFNTAQVIRGLLAVHQISGDATLLDGAVRAGRWLVSVQELDGAWRNHNFLGVERTYDTYVDAPLLALYEVTGDPRLKGAAVRNLERVLSHQSTNGWFANADNTLAHNDRPITHTLAYTLDGLIECGERLVDARWIDAAERPARALLDLFLLHGGLHGRYDAQWHGTELPLTTGGAQLAIVWSRLHSAGRQGPFREGALRMAGWLCGVQRSSANGPVASRGALPGSFPLWGRYEKFAFPNWATKYTADALLCADALVDG